MAVLHTAACALALGSVTPRTRRAACFAAPQLHAQRLSRSGAALSAPPVPSAPQRAARARRGVMLVAPGAAPLRRTVGASGPQLDLTEENVEQVLRDARVELKQMFDEQMGMTGTCTLVDLDGPFVTLRLMGRFWHPRGMVLARVGQFLQTRIPEVAEVRIENEKQLDDSAENF